MDLFKAIFAESSSSESEAEEEAERGTSPAPPPPQEAAAASSQVGDVADQKSRKTRWQDLSVVASRPLTTAADHHESNTTSNTAEKTAGKEGGDAAANRDTVANDNRAVAVFGPSLPPGVVYQHSLSTVLSKFPIFLQDLVELGRKKKKRVSERETKNTSTGTTGHRQGKGNAENTKSRRTKRWALSRVTTEVILPPPLPTPGSQAQEERRQKGVKTQTLEPKKYPYKKILFKKTLVNVR